MKTLIPYLVVTTLIVLISCDVDQDPLIENDSSNLIVKIIEPKVETTTTEQRAHIQESLSQESIDLERSMQWASYIAAHTLTYFPDAAEDFLDKKGPSDHIDLSEVIGTDISNPDNEFQNRYKESLVFFVEILLREKQNGKGNKGLGSPDATLPDICRPETASNTPPPPLGPTNPNGAPQSGDPLPFEVEVEIIANNFIASILANECLEFYFPLNMYNDDFDQISSTAHPLNSSLNNNAIARNRIPIYPGDICNNQHYTLEYTITPDYVSTTSDVVIVTRPKMSITPNPNCMYEYDINFTQFLNFLN